MKRITSIFVVGLMTGALLSGTATTPSLGAAPLNGRILFTRCKPAMACQIYTANPDGSAIRRVTTDGENFQGDWSPNGKRIAYVGSASGDYAIWIARADGSHARQLTPNDPHSDNFWPRFTPGGRRLLFTNCHGGDCDGGIGSVRTDGSHFHLVTPNSHDSYNLADPSPNGARMTYMRWHVEGVKMAIYVSDADGGNEARVSPPRLEGWYPDWSPTGARIVFTSYVFWDRPAPSLYSVRPDGGGLQALTHPPLPHSDTEGSYSPDGTKIIFNSDRRYDSSFFADLYTIDAGGGNLQRITLPFDAYDPRWGTAPVLPTTTTRSARIATVLGGSPCSFLPALAEAPMCRWIGRSS
jgi:Tol biopolymer transport system component